MMTVHEVSELTGLSVRTLQYYDKVGLLHPVAYTDAGYRLYDDSSLEKLQQILLFRELEFPLKDIRSIIESPEFDQGKALEQQITLLEMKKEHLENLILFARGIKMLGVKFMNGNNKPDFSIFDTGKIDERVAQVKATWGQTPEYREFEEKDKGRTEADREIITDQMMEIFIEFGRIKDQSPDSPQAQALVKNLQDFITEHFYTCSDKVLKGLGLMYGGGGELTENINKTAGEGAAEFASAAIAVY